MKICVIAGRYAISGVPLAQLRFARALASYGHDVELVFGMVNPGYSLPEIEGIKIRTLNKARVSSMLGILIDYYKKQKPDVVFSAGDHLNAVVLMAALISRSNAKISCSSRVTPFDTYSNVPFSKRWILKQFMRILMPRANAMTCVSEDMVEQYRQVFKSPPHVCVYNIIGDSQTQSKIDEEVIEDWLVNKTEPVIVGAGSLELWKGFSDLILAMNELLKTRQVKLIILGDGPLRAELQSLIERLDLTSSVKLIGYVENPLKYFSRSDIFVLSSHVEGMPNVLVEAMMCGCTPVSTDCPTGPRELLQDGKYGYLVPLCSPIAMADAIANALDCPIAANMLQDAISPFSVNNVIARHFEILGVEFQINKDSFIKVATIRHLSNPPEGS
jgi:glycosyltransferase involved in cell wall biosynthesis